jgi:hypothetical protein
MLVCCVSGGVSQLVQVQHWQMDGGGGDGQNATAVPHPCSTGRECGAWVMDQADKTSRRTGRYSRCSRPTHPTEGITGAGTEKRSPSFYLDLKCAGQGWASKAQNIAEEVQFSWSQIPIRLQCLFQCPANSIRPFNGFRSIGREGQRESYQRLPAWDAGSSQRPAGPLIC